MQQERVRIFLSYARADGAAAAARLRRELKDKFVVWRDIEDLRGGEDWRQQMHAALKEVDVVLLLVTPRALESAEVTTEWNMALALEKRVIPVLIASGCAVPSALENLQRRDLSQPDEYTSEFIALLGDLEDAARTLWQPLEKELSALLEDATFRPVQPLVEKLRNWASARAYPRDIFESLISLVRQFQADHQHGRRLGEVLDEALNGTYVQPGWPVYEVYQRERQIFQTALGLFRSLVPDEGVPVPIVLLVMTAAEARELVQGTAFEGYPPDLRTEFEELCSLLVANGVGDWQERYGDRSEEWRPFGSGTAETIAQLVGRAFDLIDGRLSRPLRPVFRDIRALCQIGQRRLLRELRSDGCVVVIDSLSLRHPKIQKAFHQCALDAYPNTSVVALAPFYSAFDIVRKMSIVLQMKVADLEFAKRQVEVDEEYGVCREICEEKELGLWLVDRVRKMHGRRPADKGIRARMFDLTGERG